MPRRLTYVLLGALVGLLLAWLILSITLEGPLSALGVTDQIRIIVAAVIFVASGAGIGNEAIAARDAQQRQVKVAEVLEEHEGLIYELHGEDKEIGARLGNQDGRISSIESRVSDLEKTGIFLPVEVVTQIDELLEEADEESGNAKSILIRHRDGDWEIVVVERPNDNDTPR